VTATGDPRYGRSFVARSAAVASPHELASVAGLGVLQRGGTAVDAMVAVNAALGVVYPHMSGAGGGSLWPIHDAASGRSTSSTQAAGPLPRPPVTATRAQ